MSWWCVISFWFLFQEIYPSNFLLKSPIKVIKWLQPLGVGISTEHKSDWTILVVYSLSMTFQLKMILCASFHKHSFRDKQFKLKKWKWPNLLCHNPSSFGIIEGWKSFSPLWRIFHFYPSMCINCCESICCNISLIIVSYLIDYDEDQKHI
jgi:hypothetical protein